MTAEQIFPRRSVLYVPAINTRAIEKAKVLPVDCIVLDLEDAIAPAMKIEARAMAVRAVQAGGFGQREVLIRINGFGTPWFFEDLQAVQNASIHALVLPKVESAATVQHIADQLPLDLRLWAMIETPLGIQRVEEIASSHIRLSALMMGTSDLGKELRVPHTADRLGFLYALSRCVLAARVAAIDIIDGVYLDMTDDAGFAVSCEQGLAMGFDGKSLIHPKQIEAANRIFMPDAADVEYANRLLQCWDEARQASLGLVVMDGRLVENLHAQSAKRVLAMAQAIARRS